MKLLAEEEAEFKVRTRRGERHLSKDDSRERGNQEIVSSMTARIREAAISRKTADPRVNRLLGLLSPRDYRRLRPHLQRIPLAYRQSLYRANKPIGFVYFIQTGVGSLVNTMTNGQAAEVGTIGNEGLVGLPIVFGDDRAPTSVYVQVPGVGLKMKAKLFTQELARSASMRIVMLRYAHAFFNQVAQSAVQSLSYHTAAMLPLDADDARPHAIGSVLLTQEFLAMMLGVQRTGVTAAAGVLQRDDLIRYTRGNVTILDRRGLLPPFLPVLQRFEEGVRSAAWRSSKPLGPN